MSPATKEMRTALFFYVLAMHLLVFITTYHWSHTGGCHNHYEDHEHFAHLPPGAMMMASSGQAVQQQQQQEEAARAAAGAADNGD